VLSGRSLCDELITRPEESYRLWCVVVCDLETSRICSPYIYDISSLRVNLGVRWGGWSKPRSGHFTTEKEKPYPMCRRLGGPQGRSGQLREISSHQDSIPGPSSPIYRLSYFLMFYTISYDDPTGSETCRSY